MVECTALEMRRAFTGTGGSNPPLSATAAQKRPFFSSLASPQSRALRGALSGRFSVDSSGSADWLFPIESFPERGGPASKHCAVHFPALGRPTYGRYPVVDHARFLAGQGLTRHQGPEGGGCRGCGGFRTGMSRRTGFVAFSSRYGMKANPDAVHTTERVPVVHIRNLTGEPLGL